MDSLEDMEKGDLSMKIVVQNQEHLSSSTPSLRNALGRSLGSSQGKNIFKVEETRKVGASKSYEMESLSLCKK